MQAIRCPRRISRRPRRATAGPSVRSLLPLLTLLVLALGGAGTAVAQNAAIDSWPLPGSVRSPDVRIVHPGTPAADSFTAAEAVSLIKTNNAIYARFHNNSGTILADGSVTVQAHYAEATPGLLPGVLEATVAALPAGAWRPLGTYVMDLEILPSDPPGYGLLPGATYPTAREIPMPARYRLACTIDCQSPLPTAFFLRVTLNLAGDTNPGDNQAFSYYDLTGGVPPADVVLLHDLSGSMASHLPLVKERAKFFLDLLNAGDRTGLAAFSTGFAGNAETFLSLNTISTIHPTDPTKTAANTVIDTDPNFIASGGTPMGSGVLEAQNVLNTGLPPYPAHRAIVMLTDGKENVGPDLKDPPGYPILNGLDTDAKGPIALYPLWFGTMSHWGKSLLEDVVMQVDQGKLVDQPQDDLELAKAYLMIRGILLADDIYAIHRGTTGDGYDNQIHVDTVSQELIVTAVWRDFDRELDIEVIPPGGNDWQPAGSVANSTSRGDLHVVHRILQPTSGAWRYRLTETDAGEPYVLSALSDQVEVLFQSKLARAAIRAGQPLEIQARLSRAGQPVTGARVQATVQVPDTGLGSLLWKYRERLQVPPEAAIRGLEDTRPLLVAEQLQELTGREQLFRYRPQRVDLTDPDGDGLYTGRFTDTRVTGTYQVTLEARGGDSGHRFERQHELAAVVSVGRIDPERSKVDVALVDRISASGAGIWRTTITPVDVYGNVLDPGYQRRVQLTAENGRWVKPLEDNLDGSYSRLIQVPPRQKPKISINVFRQRLPVLEENFRDILDLDEPLRPRRPVLDPRRPRPQPVDPDEPPRPFDPSDPHTPNDRGPHGPQE